MNTYEQWLRRFLRFHGLRHLREMGSSEVNAFLAHLAVERKVSASTQNQALAALLFLYRELLKQDLDFQRRELTVRNGKGGKDRRSLLPNRVGQQLQDHLVAVRRVHRQDLAEGYGRVPLPHALGRKYPTLRWSGAGSGCFHNTTDGAIRPRVSRAGTISIPA